jgi:hypothetical protein
MAKANRGWFRRGHDPRRHQLTQEECRKGYRTTLARLSFLKRDTLWLQWRAKQAHRKKHHKGECTCNM